VLRPGTVVRGVRVAGTASPDEVFAIAASPARNLGIVVADVDAYGVVFVDDLHTVFPAIRLIALAEAPTTRARAVRAGAVLALPRNVPPKQLAKAIVRVSGR
jgi:DNA-binding NarL/FixJ family response regulator